MALRAASDSWAKLAFASAASPRAFSAAAAAIVSLFCSAAASITTVAEDSRAWTQRSRSSQRSRYASAV
eukprot:6059128-Pleurochrysis_carterae.AAC.4